MKQKAKKNNPRVDPLSIRSYWYTIKPRNYNLNWFPHLKGFLFSPSHSTDFLSSLNLKMTDESVRFISPMVRFISQIWELTWFWQKWKLRSDWLSNECLILFGVWFWIIHQNFLMASSKYIKSSTCNEFWLLYYKSMILAVNINISGPDRTTWS